MKSAHWFAAFAFVVACSPTPNAASPGAAPADAAPADAAPGTDAAPGSDAARSAPGQGDAAPGDVGASSGVNSPQADAPAPGSPEPGSFTPKPTSTSAPAAPRAAYSGKLTLASVATAIDAITADATKNLDAAAALTFSDRVAMFTEIGKYGMMVNPEFARPLIAARLSTTPDDVRAFLRSLDPNAEETRRMLKPSYDRRTAAFKAFRDQTRAGKMPGASKASCVVVKKRSVELALKMPKSKDEALAEPSLSTILLPLKVAEKALTGCVENGFNCIVEAPTEKAIAACP